MNTIELTMEDLQAQLLMSRYMRDRYTRLVEATPEGEAIFGYYLGEEQQYRKEAEYWEGEIKERMIKRG